MAIRNSEQILRMAEISAFEYDAATGVVTWDEGIYRLFGDAFGGSRESWERMIDIEDRKHTMACLAESIMNATSFSIKYRIRHCDTGQIRHIMARGEAVQDARGVITHLVGISWDRTVEESARAQVRQQEHFNNIMFENFNDPAYVLTEDGHWILANQALCRHFGVQKQNVIGRHESEFLSPEKIERSRLFRQPFFDQPDGVHEFQTQSIAHDGQVADFQNSLRTYFDAVIGKRCLVGVSINLTRIQQDYQTLKNLGQMIESSDEFQGYFSLTGKAVFINPAGYTRFGIDQTKSLRHHMSPETVRVILREALPTAVRGETWTGETTLIHSKTGEKIQCMQKVFAIFDGAGKHCYFGTNVRDIRDEKRRESALIHSSRMASLGAMASGIAHEINNPLTAIMAKAHLVKRMIRANASAAPDQFNEELKHLDRVEELSRRISQIVNSMRLLARQDNSQAVAVVPLAGCFEELKLLSHERMVRNQIEFNMNLGSLESIMGSESQLVQVLINLCNNAVDALEGRRNKWISVDVTSDDKLGYIRVTDAGEGIEPAVVQKIMEPFFTTKAPGAGTGLGLSVSKNLVEGMGGRLYYDAKSANTCFVIELPHTAAGDLEVFAEKIAS